MTKKQIEMKEFSKTLKSVKVEIKNQHIQVIAGFNYILNIDKSEIDFEKKDKDLKVIIKDGNEIIFIDYFTINKTELVSLVSIHDDNNIYHITIDELGAVIDILISQYTINEWVIGMGGTVASGASSESGDIEPPTPEPTPEPGITIRLPTEPGLPTRITGTDGDDIINAGDGNDIIKGGGGNDLIHGGGGESYIYGDEGDDTIYGGIGMEEISGGMGSDVIMGGGGSDHISSGDGNDILYISSANDFSTFNRGVLSGGNGNDELHGDAGSNLLWGGEGNDLLYDHDGNDNLHGDTNNNLGDTNTRAIIGDDVLIGGKGDDRLEGGGGRDTFVYTSITDGHDTITDFHLGFGNTFEQDTLDLSGS